jgi:hypothetical protein
MSELPVNDEIVTIDGKQYSRLLAEEMARDIEYVSERRPSAWAITPNSALMVGASAFLSSAVPVRHGYLVDADGTSEEVQSLIAAFQTDFRSTAHEHVRALQLPSEDLLSRLTLLRPAHEAAIQHALEYSQKCNYWRKHDFARTRALEQIVGRALPEPGYAEELRQLQETQPSPESDGEADLRYWKISPGGAGKYWQEFQDRSVIAVHWSDEPVDLSIYPDAYPDFIERAKSELAVSDQGARSLWDFSKVMQPGDMILAYANQAVVGHGMVTGNYELVEDDFEYKHRRPVIWESVESKPVVGLSDDLQARLKTQATLFELTREQFMAATGRDQVTELIESLPWGPGTPNCQ